MVLKKASLLKKRKILSVLIRFGSFSSKGIRFPGRGLKKIPIQDISQLPTHKSSRIQEAVKSKEELEGLAFREASEKIRLLCGDKPDYTSPNFIKIVSNYNKQHKFLQQSLEERFPEIDFNSSSSSESLLNPSGTNLVAPSKDSVIDKTDKSLRVLTNSLTLAEKSTAALEKKPSIGDFVDTPDV